MEVSPDALWIRFGKMVMETELLRDQIAQQTTTLTRQANIIKDLTTTNNELKDRIAAVPPQTERGVALPTNGIPVEN